MSRPKGQLQRSLAALTIGVAQGAQQRKRTLADGYTGEYEQQVHVPISGYGAPAYVFADVAVNWELPFVYAPMQRRVPFTTPHFTYGIEMVGSSGGLVIITAHVEAWTTDASSNFTGATVRLAATAPIAEAVFPYSAVAHLSFQGYATYAEGAEFAQ
jgi:hypothetical protein